MMSTAVNMMSGLISIVAPWVKIRVAAKVKVQLSKGEAADNGAGRHNDNSICALLNTTANSAI